jgi:hypothetical protein
MIFILKREGIWDLTKCKVTSMNFLAIVIRESLIEIFFKENK